MALADIWYVKSRIGKLQTAVPCSEANMKFFTSDEHYGHANIIKYAKRPFSDLTDMRENLIARHNSKVGPGDVTYHLGDLFWRTLSVKEALAIVDRLNGQHAYVWGNHCELVEDSAELRAAFTSIDHIKYVNKGVNHPKIVLCHYAMRVWRGSHNGTWHLYGHTHAMLPEANTLSFDVGVDACDYSPMSVEEIAAKMQLKKLAGAEDPMAARIAADDWGHDRGCQ